MKKLLLIILILAIIWMVISIANTSVSPSDYPDDSVIAGVYVSDSGLPEDTVVDNHYFGLTKSGPVYAYEHRWFKCMFSPGSSCWIIR